MFQRPHPRPLTSTLTAPHCLRLHPLVAWSSLQMASGPRPLSQHSTHLLPPAPPTHTGHHACIQAAKQKRGHAMQAGFIFSS